MCKCCPRKAVVCIAFTHRLLEYYYYYYFFLHLHLFCLFSISLYYSSQLFLSYECHYLLTDHFFLSSFIICLPFFYHPTVHSYSFYTKMKTQESTIISAWSGVEFHAGPQWGGVPRRSPRGGGVGIQFYHRYSRAMMGEAPAGEKGALRPRKAPPTRNGSRPLVGGAPGYGMAEAGWRGWGGGSGGGEDRKEEGGKKKGRKEEEEREEEREKEMEKAEKMGYEGMLI